MKKSDVFQQHVFQMNIQKSPAANAWQQEKEKYNSMYRVMYFYGEHH